MPQPFEMYVILQHDLGARDNAVLLNIYSVTFFLFWSNPYLCSLYLTFGMSTLILYQFI